MGKTKAYSACSCPDPFSFEVRGKFFSIAVDYDTPSNFDFFQFFDGSFDNVQLLA